MGKELALAAFRLGADVTIIHRDDVRCVRNIRSDTAASMLEAVSREFAEKDVDLYMSAAAVSDYAPVRHPGKIPGGHPVTLDLRPLPKILDLAIPRAKVTVAFKVGEKSTEEAGILLEKGVARPDGCSGRSQCSGSHGFLIWNVYPDRPDRNEGIVRKQGRDR